MDTTAARLATLPAADAMEQADALTDDKDQDWTNEATTWTFEDGSKLRVSGPFAEDITNG